MIPELLRGPISSRGADRVYTSTPNHNNSAVASTVLLGGLACKPVVPTSLLLFPVTQTKARHYLRSTFIQQGQDGDVYCTHIYSPVCDSDSCLLRLAWHAVCERAIHTVIKGVKRQQDLWQTLHSQKKKQLVWRMLLISAQAAVDTHFCVEPPKWWQGAGDRAGISICHIYTSLYLYVSTCKFHSVLHVLFWLGIILYPHFFPVASMLGWDPWRSQEKSLHIAKS